MIAFNKITRFRFNQTNGNYSMRDSVIKRQIRGPKTNKNCTVGSNSKEGCTTQCFILQNSFILVTVARLKITFLNCLEIQF